MREKVFIIEEYFLFNISQGQKKKGDKVYREQMLYIRNIQYFNLKTTVKVYVYH